MDFYRSITILLSPLTMSWTSTWRICLPTVEIPPDLWVFEYTPKPEACSRWHSSISNSAPEVDKIMTGMSFSLSSALTSLRNSFPPIPGMLRYSRMIFGRGFCGLPSQFCERYRNLSSPDATIRTSQFHCRSSGDFCQFLVAGE